MQMPKTNTAVLPLPRLTAILVFPLQVLGLFAVSQALRAAGDASDFITDSNSICAVLYSIVENDIKIGAAVTFSILQDFFTFTIQCNSHKCNICQILGAFIVKKYQQKQALDHVLGQEIIGYVESHCDCMRFVLTKIKVSIKEDGNRIQKCSLLVAQLIKASPVQ